MKKLLLIFAFFSSAAVFSQSAKFNQIQTEGNFKEYISKDHKSVKIGDTLSIGLPSNGSLFRFVTQGNQPAASQISNTTAIVEKIKTKGNKKTGFKTYIIFSGWGMLPVYIDYESALETGEVKI